MLDFPRWKIVLIIGICLTGFLLCIPNFLTDEQKQNLPSFYTEQTFNLGLDLRGGSHLLLAIDYDKYIEEQYAMVSEQIRKTLRQNRVGYRGLKSNIDGVSFKLRQSDQAADAKKFIRADIQSSVFQQNDLEMKVSFSDAYINELKRKVVLQSIEIVRRRVDETGTKEPIIQQQGIDYILLQVPGLDDPSKLKQVLGKTAKLTFHEVNEATSPSQAQQGITDSDSQILPLENVPGQVLAVKKRNVMSGDMLVDASTAYQDGSPVVSFKLNDIGGRIFADYTRRNVGKRFAVVLDNKIITAPVINSAILTGSGIITGNFDVDSANDLALLLRAGALPAPLNIVEERTVGPSLGQDSIESGKLAGLVSVMLVVVFMVATYLKFGVFASVALAVNMILLMAGMSLLGATLTMPGIAGVILTLGMAVDANVLIFERIREETRLGLTPFAAVDQGFSLALRTIADSNITTLIVAFILYGFGTGPIKGFAVTLSFGILASMFSAITVTRMMVVLWLKSVRPKVLRI